MGIVSYKMDRFYFVWNKTMSTELVVLHFIKSTFKNLKENR